MTSNEKIPFGLYKNYLKTGEIPLGLGAGDYLFDIGVAQALLLRRHARVADEQAQNLELEDEEYSQKKQEASQLRTESREALINRNNLVNHEIIQRIFNFDQDFSVNEELSHIIEYLQSDEIGYTKGSGKKLPVLSSMDSQMLSQLQEHFDVQMIPTDQIDISDFDNILSKSQVPEWFTEIMQHRKETEYVNIFEEIRQRWFLFACVMLAVASAAGFIFDWGVEVANLSKDFTLFLSIYGVVALGRSSWQTARAEKWVKEARSYNRPPIIDSFGDLVDGTVTDEDTKNEILNQCIDIEAKNYGWEQFKVELGLKKSKNFNKPTPVKKFIDYLIARNAFPFTSKMSEEEQIEKIRQTIIDNIATKTFDSFQEKYGKKQPSVAFVIPTYQTPIHEMRGLLVSIKDQAYGIGQDDETRMTAYVVYNDDPNGSDKKQAEFAEFQKLVNEMNKAKGRNNCKIELLAQPSRGKREAMMAGFMMGMGRGYFEQLSDMLWPEFAKNYSKHNPQATVAEAEQAFKQKMDEMVANFPVSKLPDFKHDRIINIDSDTRIDDPFAVLNSELMMQENPNAGCITGDVRVENRNVNFLTELTFQRYWIAFFKERASQSPEVTCMSGPWVYMDSDKLGEIMPMWYFYEHIAGRATFGDDREISTRMLEAGYSSLFCPDSAVWTDAPDSYEVWLKQQLRWNKSFTIYNMVLFNFLHKMDKFVQMDVIYQQTFPFAMLFIGSNIAKEALQIGLEEGWAEGAGSVLPYAVIIFLFNELFFGVYGTIKNKVENEDGTFSHDYRFLLSPVYIFYHFRYLLWTKLYSFYDLFYKGNTDWGTKGEEFDEVFNIEQSLNTLRDMESEIADEIIKEFEQNAGDYPRRDVSMEELENEDDDNGDQHQWFQGN